MYKHVMADNETLGRTPRAVVVSIGLAAFDPDAHVFGKLPVGRSIRLVLNRDEQSAGGRELCPETAAWWAEQSSEARAVFDEPQEPVRSALGKLHAFIMASTVGGKEVQMWGNGSDFDLSMLEDLHRWAGMDLPWTGGFNNRCFRTLKTQMREDYQVISGRVGRSTHHDCEDDARWQAEVAWRLLGLQASHREVAQAALALTDGDNQLAFGPVMAGPERNLLQTAINGMERFNIAPHTIVLSRLRKAVGHGG